MRTLFEGVGYLFNFNGEVMINKFMSVFVVAAILIGASFVSTQAATTIWSVDGRTIKVNGDPIIVKGVNYSPAPIGANTAWTPFGDYFIPTWHKIWERDFPALRKMGANSIRLYFMYPYVKNNDFSNGAVADHSGFLDAAYNKGAEPVYVFVAYPITNVLFRYKQVDTIPTNGIWYYQESEHGKIWVVDEAYDADIAAPRRANQKSEYLTLVKQLADNPAVMGFVVSNEANNGIARNHPAFWKWLDDLGSDIKNVAPGKLTTIALVDDSMESVTLAEKLNNKMPNIDIWGINSYRGTVSRGFDVLFSSFAATSSKALLVTEFGCPASGRSGGAIVELPNNAKAQADYLKVHWNDIAANQNISAGGYVFEWSDEWWKDGNPAAHDAASATNSAFPGGYGDEEWFGINSIAVNNRPANDPWNPGQPNDPDLLGSRAVYDTLADLWK